MFRKLSSLHKYTAHTTTILFVLGFVFDMIMLPDISHLFTRFIGAGYLIIIALLIMFREWIISRNTASLFEQKVYSFATFGVSYFSGSALSFICVYSLRSASFLVSWPLFVILLLCIIANEFVSTHDFRFTLDIGIFLIATVFFVIFNMPLLVNRQNDFIFLMSILASVTISLLYLYVLGFTSESAKHEAPKAYALAVGIPMFVCMLYFLNVIPAVPLSLKESGVYHSISHTDGGEFLAQKESDTRILKKYRRELYHLSGNETTMYFFSNIDTPAKLTAPVSHVWEFYNTETNRWEEKTRISFDIQGGREAGYRAFSYKENIQEGLWRVTVKIGENRVIGREKFQVIKVNEVVETKETSL